MSDSYIGLIGAVVGAVITGGFTFFTDWLKNRNKNKKGLEVLALKLTYKLELYAAQCLDCYKDDGEEVCEDQDGVCYGGSFKGYEIDFPDFTLGNLDDIDWKLLPVKLMHEIFILPASVSNAKVRVLKELEEYLTHDNSDYPTTLRAKQLIDVALKFYVISYELRKVSGLPLPNDSIVIDTLNKNKIKIDGHYDRLFIKKE
ncbi:hypothetical protein [Pantoea sp. ME81]|uniref:hypothetical protein n=1 Tax=Pantoea sp. ME81 TaxID=2743935 RepID=UPI0015F3AD30|nr:hypothetical protein [Pantoea sp. ME81]